MLAIPFILLLITAKNLWRSRARTVNYVACFATAAIGVYFFWTGGASAFETFRGGRLAAEKWASAVAAYQFLAGICLMLAVLVTAVATAIYERQTRATWAERIINGSLLGMTALLVYLTAMQLSFWQSFFLWTVFALGMLITTWLVHIKLFGPVLFYDMVRTGRRNRYFIVRMLYGGFLFSFSPTWCCSRT